MSLSCCTRREWLAATGAALIGGACTRPFAGPVDIHQHVNYHGRSDDGLIAHQEALGMVKTILLPAGREASRASTHEGRSFGLAARVLGNEAARRLVEAHPGKFVYCANEITDLDEAPAEIEKHLKRGAVGIGEQKFHVACDSTESRRLYDLARAYDVPVLLHFQTNTYNTGYEGFFRMLEAYPTVRFIAHAQATWGHIDAKHDPKVNYPEGKVTPGGLTDLWLTRYPNFFADLSAGSGLNAFTRDEEHGAAFFARHTDKLLYGSDCQDVAAKPDEKACCGSRMLALIHRLVPDAAARARILGENARRVFKIA